MKSVFTDKNFTPTDAELRRALGDTYSFWQDIEYYALTNNNGFSTEWKYSGEKFGWGYRINDKKRVLIYLLPRQGFFKVAFVFGQKATDIVLQSEVNQQIKVEFATAKAYSEGRGVRIDVNDASLLEDIKKLILIKIKH